MPGISERDYQILKGRQLANLTRRVVLCSELPLSSGARVVAISSGNAYGVARSSSIFGGKISSLIE